MVATPKKGSCMNVEIAQRLAEMRREKGYSQEELAAQLGLSRQAVSKWERAESSPDTGNLIALARLYGVTLDELVSVEADIAEDVSFEQQDRAQTAASVPPPVYAAVPPAPQSPSYDGFRPPAPSQPAPVEGRPLQEQDREGRRRRNNPWLTFPYPVLCVILFLLFGFLFDAWHPAWVIFLTIPLYYWIAHVVVNDPNYRADHPDRR